MVNARVARGRRTQEIVANWFRQHGWPEAEAVPAALPGRDIRKMLGLAPEVKATERLDLTGSLTQATANAAGDLPFVIYRPRGYGVERLAFWPVLMRLDDLTQLLRDANYGEQSPPETEPPHCPAISGGGLECELEPGHGGQHLRRVTKTVNNVWRYGESK